MKEECFLHQLQRQVTHHKLPMYFHICISCFWVACMIGNFTKLLCYANILVVYIATPFTYINLVAFRLSRCLEMLQNCFTRCWGKILSTKLNEPPGWIDIERFMLSGYSGPCSWWFSTWATPRTVDVVVFNLRVNLWFATQEQRDDEVLSSLDASSAAFWQWALSWSIKLNELT